MKKTKLLVGLMITALSLSLFVGCGRGSGSSTESPSPSATTEATETKDADSTKETDATAEKTDEASADAGSKTTSDADYSGVTIGAAIYKFDDTFMTGVRSAMQERSDALGLKLELVDSQNKQTVQNEQVDTFITKGVTALSVNPVDRTAAGPIIDKAKEADLPIVFINREPEAIDMDKYDKVWYVGAHAEQSGTFSGEIIAEYFEANPSADKNGDHKIQYILLKGEQGHQDATLRSEYAPKALADKGWEGVELGSDNADWDKVKATDKMKAYISSVGIENIEAVLANNDDIALGAIEALKAEGYNTGDPEKFIPVVGVDATAPALEAMKEGALLGTVLNDATNQGTAAVNISAAAAIGEPITTETIGYDVTDAEGKPSDNGKYVWINYVKVTKDNYTEFIK